MAIHMELNVHSHGDMRCTVRDGDGYATAHLKHKDSHRGAVDGVCFFLETPAEIAAFKALSAALAAQDVVEEVV